MRKTTIGAAAVAAALAVAGCAHGVPETAQHARLTCKTLAGGTWFEEAGGGQDQLAAATVLAEQAPAGYFTVKFQRDLKAVIDTGLYNPEQPAVDALTADCRAVGVTKKVWPSDLTGGNM